jgi:hypothetical protein
VKEAPRKDFAITIILACIWFGAVGLVLKTRDDISFYVLAVATLFFIMLVPAMKELIRSADRYSGKHRDTDQVAGDD